MNTKFFKEIQKKMSVKTIKDFKKELRTKIRDEFEIEGKTNLNLARVLFASEFQLRENIRNGRYSWVEIDSDRKKRLFKLTEIYKEFLS